MDPRQYRYLAIRISPQSVKPALAHIESVFKSFTPKYPFEYRFLDEVLGASETGIFVMLSRDFVRWVIVWTSFVLAGLISLSIALLTVSWQGVTIARTNPARALKYE